MVEIYWDDLTEEKQREILEVFGDNQNFDQFPVAVLPGPAETENFYLSYCVCFGVSFAYQPERRKSSE